MTYSNTLYPNQKDTADFMEVIDGTTRINKTLFDKFSGTILAIEKELGIKPSGVYSDVRQRLDALETLYIYGASHSTTIATEFLFDWLSPVLPGPIIFSSTLGKISMNLYREAGFPDGYGTIEWKSLFFVDSDIDTFELSLWEVTSTPTELLANTFGPGEQIYNVTLSLPITDADRLFEIRGKQTSSAIIPTNISSQMWNSRFVFQATGNFAGTLPTPQFKYISMTFDGYDGYDSILGVGVDGYKYIGSIETQSMIQAVSLIIDQPFDAFIQLSVGDMSVNDRLMTIADNIPSVADIYRAGSDVEYFVSTPIYIYLTNNTSTIGSGEVIVYYH